MSSRYIYAMLICLLTVVSINSNFLEEGPLTKEAHDEIDQLFDKLFIESISPITELLFKKDKGEKTCGYCKLIISQVRDYVVTKHGFQGLYQFLTKVCTTVGMDENVCQNAVSGYAPLIFNGLVNKMFDETHLCALLKLCKEGNKYLNPDDFANFYLTECALRLRAVLDRFNYIIRGHFTGHTHVDDIIGVHSYFNASDIIDINYVAPALTTYSNHLPSFRVYQVDSNTKHIVDYEQYRFNVTEANIKGGAKGIFRIRRLSFIR